MNSINGAEIYDGVDDLWLITSYFNPAHYQSKKRNYEKFVAKIKASGLHLITIECAFGEGDFDLPDAKDTIKLRAKDVMWQKERLLNLAISQLPEECKKLLWIDFDINFENPAWAVETSRLLEDYPLIQPFHQAILLNKDATAFQGQEKIWPSFCAAYLADPESARSGDFQNHGLPGYAWAVRRELIAKHGLYDAAIIGGGDHLIAHTACGDWQTKCFHWSIGTHTNHYQYFLRWAEPFYQSVKANINYVPGTILHTWHGDWNNRNYTNRHKELRKFGYDPALDIKIGANGLWEWASDKPELHEFAINYFLNRRED